MADTDITKATATTETASKMEGTASENEYGSSNTNDYSQNITDQYAQFVQDYDAATEAAVQNATSQLERIRAVGERTAEENAQLAKQDSEELRRTRRAMEQNEGNRQRIGESQYGVAENAYDQQMAVIESVKNKLRTDTARQVADLRAQGDYASANAALETAQAQFRQLYEEGLRVSGNLRSNYEYQTELQREDEAIAREQDSEELDWKRSMGEFMLKHGVMPTDEILAALGIDSSAAQLYINAVSSGYYSGGSSGSSRSSGSSSSSSSSKTAAATPTTTTPTTGSTGTTQKAWSNADASVINSYIKSGQYANAYSYLNQSYSAGNFSQQNATSLYNKIQSAAKAAATAAKASGLSNKKTSSTASTKVSAKSIASTK